MIIPNENETTNKTADVGADQSNAGQDNTTPSEAVTSAIKSLRDEIKLLVEQAVAEAAKPMAEARQAINEQASRLEEAVQNSQASLMIPDFNDGSSLDYVKKVVEEDQKTRRLSPDGKARYSERGEDLTKAKIIILKKMGLSDEEVAKSLFDN